MNQIEELITTKVEEERDLVPGDFKRVVNALWFTIRILIASDAMYSIRVPRFGLFEPNFILINKKLKREYHIYRSGGDNKEKLMQIIAIRRRIIKKGRAVKSYYLKKMCRNGKVDGRGVGQDYQYVRDSLERIGKARHQKWD